MPPCQPLCPYEGRYTSFCAKQVGELFRELISTQTIRFTLSLIVLILLLSKTDSLGPVMVIDILVFACTYDDLMGDCKAPGSIR